MVERVSPFKSVSKVDTVAPVSDGIKADEHKTVNIVPLRSEEPNAVPDVPEDVKNNITYNKAEIASNRLDYVDVCPVCSKTMVKTLAGGHKVNFCSQHRVVLPVKD